MMIGLRKIDTSKIKPMSREEHTAKIAQWFEAQRKLEEICKEKGIPVPIMVC